MLGVILRLMRMIYKFKSELVFYKLLINIKF